MGLYVFITENEMIDAASINHFVMADGTLTVQMHNCKLSYVGPFAQKVLRLLKKSLETENESYTLNCSLMERASDSPDVDFDGLDEMDFD